MDGKHLFHNAKYIEGRFYSNFMNKRNNLLKALAAIIALSTTTGCGGDDFEEEKDAYTMKNVFFVPILKSQLGDKTPIQEMMELAVDSEDEENDATDTRSYMYIEMALDLTNTNSWILGKGAYSHYYSEFEHQNFKGQGVDYGRVTTEVPFLNYLLRGGVVYVFLYLSLFIVAIFKGILYGKR